MGTTWELDFYARPILDDRQKKLWEVLVCESPSDARRDPESLFRFARYCASNEANSATLREFLKEAIAAAPAPPTKIRFFRRQMNNTIVKVCKELGVQAVPSRRTVALACWLEERSKSVYPHHPNFQAPAANAPGAIDAPSAPQRLPDALMGQKWAFVSLEAAALKDMSAWSIDFGEGFSLDLLDLPGDAIAPGIVLLSRRAFALAGWMSGLELAFVTYREGNLVLEAEANVAWVLEKISNPQVRQEAEAFEAAKQRARGLHFLAVQVDPQAEAFAGFWMLREMTLK